MPTIHREQGMRFIVYIDDHEPAHVHVRGDGEAKIVLGMNGRDPQLVWSYGMTLRDVRRALRIVVAENDKLLHEWMKIHG